MSIFVLDIEIWVYFWVLCVFSNVGKALLVLLLFFSTGQHWGKHVWKDELGYNRLQSIHILGIATHGLEAYETTS